MTTWLMGQDILPHVLSPTEMHCINYLETSYKNTFTLVRPCYILEWPYGCSKLHRIIYVYKKLPWL